jgi:FkbM family methyltransferase
VNTLEKTRLYVRAGWALGKPNLKGLPFVPKQLLNLPIHNRGSYNEFIIWICSLCLSSVRWVVDVGANHGDFAEAAAACFPSANVLLVEPLPHLHDELGRRCARRNGKWLLEKSALGSEDKMLPLYFAPGQDAIGSLIGFSSEYQHVNPQSKIDQIPCNVRRLDAVAAGHKVSRIDLLKIDVEGFEFEVLKGATDVLPNTRAIIIEVSLVRRPTDIRDPLVAMLDLLATNEFHVIDVIPSVWDPSRTWKPIEFNILARRQDGADA